MLKRVQIPSTSLSVSRISLGTANLGIKQSEDDAHALLDRFISLGGNFIDTARVYSDWIPGEKGRCERIIGDWLRERPGVRSQLVIATKGAHYEWSDKTLNRVNPESVQSDLELSLETLGLEEIDIWYLHRDSLTLPPEAIVDFMQPFVESGRIRYLGVANWGSARLQAANAYAEGNGLSKFIVNQPLFNLGAWNMVGDPKDPTMAHLDCLGRDYHRESGMALAPYSSQAQGFFTKAAGEMDFDEDAFRRSRYYSQENLAVAQVVKDLADAKGCNANGIVLAYLIHQPFPVIPIVGCYSIPLLEDSVRAASVELSTKEFEALEAAAGAYSRSAG